MTIDYATHKLSIGRKLPEEKSEFTLPMRHHRLSMVRGLLNDKRPTYFVVDTGGEVISISTTTAEELDHDIPRKIALRVYGTSGWDRDAFLMPGVNLKFNQINYNNFAVVVLNLQAPSVLLGFQVGGIVGHKFLSPYRVSLDLDRSELRMSKAASGQLAGQASWVLGLQFVSGPNARQNAGRTPQLRPFRSSSRTTPTRWASFSAAR